MAEWILGYQKSVEGAGPGLSNEEWQRYESEVPEHPPAQLRSLYKAFDGGALNGGVKLYPFERVVEARNTSEDQSWVFGEKAQQRLLAARKATLASHPGLMIRPGWFETTHADELVFAAHDARQGTVRVYPSLEQLLSVMVPPAQLEVFGEQTYARAMAAVESVISGVADKVRAERKKKSPAKKAASPKKSASAKKSPTARKAPAARKAPKKPVAKKKATAQKRSKPAPAKKAARGKKRR
ncbi:MAG: hypothetical protein ACJ790_08680 [Myxococcaceae bacterium]